jgi:hypothetical protein
MLPDRYRQLLTAYVDGELTSRQRRHVARLLHRSAEARQLLRQLQDDSQALRRLPRLTLPADLSATVLQRIGQRRPGHAPSHRLRLSATPYPAWAGLITAAAVLLVVGLASYLYFAASVPPTDGPVAKQQQSPTEPPPVSTPSNEGEPPALAHGEQTPKGPEVSPSPQDRQPPAPPEVVSVPPKPGPNPPSPPERPREESVFTDRLETWRIGLVDSSFLPGVFKLGDLDQPAGARKLLAELAKDNAFRIELPARHGTRALERLQSVLKARQVNTVLDQWVQDHLKTPQVRANYAFYLDNLTPDDLLALLKQSAAEDKKGAHRPSEIQFERLVLARMSPADHKELSALLGTDPTQAAAPRPAGPLGTDPSRPLSDLTAQQVAQALAAPGGRPPSAGKNAVNALALLYTPGRPHTGSAEVKHFLDTRKPPVPGTLRILLVLRGPASG